ATILAEASEIRTRTVTTMDYRGTSWGFTGDNFAWNRGSVRVHNRDKDYVASFGSGQLAITDRRLMIALPNDTFSIAYSSIVQVDSFPDGLKIHPSSGKPLMLSYRNDPTIAVVLARCLAGGAPLAAAPAGNPRGQ